jgi:hypothetical protein
MAGTPFGLIGVSCGTAQKNDIAMRAGKSAAGAVSVIASFFPSTTTPEMCLALPTSYAASPAMSWTYAPAAPIFGLRLRSIAYLKVAAVTRSCSGGENAKPSRIVNV